MQGSSEEPTTLGFYRGLLVGGGASLFILALAVPVAAITLTHHHKPNNHSELFIVIPLAVLYAVVLTFRGVRIFRTRITVTPSILTAYWFQGRHSVPRTTRRSEPMPSISGFCARLAS